jgi:3-hydroxyisobutyrate dehydrogenase
MSIAPSDARQMKLAMPGLSLTAQLFNALQAQGLGRKGTHALYLLLERLSDVKSKS